MVPDQEEQHDHAGAPQQIGGEQDETPVEPVRDEAGGDRQQDVRDHPDGTEEPDGGGALGLAVDHDEDRDDVQPVADAADELADQQLGQRPVGQQAPVDAKSLHPSL